MSARVVLAVLLFFGFIVNYIMRVNINITIISMADPNYEGCLKKSGGGTSYLNGQGYRVFCWSEADKGTILGSFFWGYMFLQIPGGRLSELYGTRRVLGVTTIIVTILTFLIPVFAQLGVFWLSLLRGVQGLFQGVLYPSAYAIIPRWIPKGETSKFSAFSMMGNSIGTVITYQICGILLASYNWTIVFYLSGLVSSIWCFLWFFYTSDDPKTHPTISKQEQALILREREYIPQKHVESINEQGRKIVAIIKNPAVQTMVFTNLAIDWGLYTMLTEGPSFISNVLKKDIKTIGFLSSLPLLCNFVLAQVFAHLSDWLVSRPHLMSVPAVRRLMMGTALIIPGIGLIAMSYLNENWIACVFVMVLCYGFTGANMSGFLTQVDIAPNLSGTVSGVVNGAGSFTGFVSPTFTSYFTQHDPTDPTGWRIVFWLGAIFYFVAAFIFIKFQKFEPQKFNFSSGKETDKREEVDLLRDTDDFNV